MRSRPTVRETRALLASAALAVVACRQPPLPFPVSVMVYTDEGRPFPGMQLTIGDKKCRTDASGHCNVGLVSTEGARIKILEDVPKGYNKVSKKDTVVMQRLTDIKRSGEQLPIEHIIVVAPTVRHYAILVDAQYPGLSIQTFGAQRAVTNSKGVAMFVHEGVPGDELKVTVSTAERGDFLPPNPVTNFKLSAHSDAYVVRERFTIKPPKVVHHHAAEKCIKTFDAATGKEICAKQLKKH
jgi:hypothetical protein